jgi:hypothetical protein
MRSADVNITFLNECYVTSQNQSADERCLKPHRIKIINTSSKLEQIQHQILKKYKYTSYSTSNPIQKVS